MNRRGLKEEARQCVREASYRPKLVTLVALLVLAALILIQVVGNYLAENVSTSSSYLSQSISSSTRSYIVTLVISLLVQLCILLLWVGYTSFVLHIHNRQSYKMQVLLDGCRRWAKSILLYLWIALMLGLWTAVISIPVSYVLSAIYLSGVISESGLYAALIIAMALIMVIFSYRYRMAWFILLDHPDLSVRKVLNEAKAITRYHRRQIFLMDLSFLPWFLLCILTLGVLFIWKLPYLASTYAGTYEFLCTSYDQRTSQDIVHQRAHYRR